MVRKPESCVCIVGFPAFGCQKKSVVYETECRHAAVQRGKQDNIYIYIYIYIRGHGEIKRREMELDPQVSPEEIMSREVELGC